mgnify:CR=1 FL=1
MNNKFLNKVIEQIISETRIIDNKLHTPFPLFSLFPPLSSYTPPFIYFSSHCKEVYGLNEQEIDYVWNEYKKGVTTLMEDKEPSHQEKG